MSRSNPSGRPTEIAVAVLALAGSALVFTAAWRFKFDDHPPLWAWAVTIAAFLAMGVASSALLVRHLRKPVRPSRTGSDRSGSGPEAADL